MTTMVDVARDAGVSVSTVSHVLNGTRHVEPETSERVRQAIEQSGYRQDALARSLRRSRTDSIGLVISDAGEPAFAEMVHGVQEAADAEEMVLLVANSNETADRELRAVRALLDRRVDGLILARVADSFDTLIDEFEQASTPFVLMDRLSSLPLDQVAMENRPAMHELVRHLVAQGHRRIVLVAGDTRVPTLRERLEAFSDAVSGAGLLPDEQSIIRCASKKDDITHSFMSEMTRTRPTAVIACSTFLAASALSIIENLGLSIPEDVAFATFDGFAYPDLFEPKLTTVRQPAFEVGATAVRLLTSRINKTAGEPTTVRLSPVIEYRASTGPVPAAKVNTGPSTDHR